MKSHIFFATGAVLAGLAVAAGAFGAHGLQRWIETGRIDAAQLANFKTAADYQMYHAIGLMLAGLLQQSGERTGRVAPWAFLAGIMLFCGCLYGNVLLRPNAPNVARKLVLLVPIGGIAFLVGWTALAVAAVRTSRQRTGSH